MVTLLPPTHRRIEVEVSTGLNTSMKAQSRPRSVGNPKLFGKGLKGLRGWMCKRVKTDVVRDVSVTCVMYSLHKYSKGVPRTDL